MNYLYFVIILCCFFNPLSAQRKLDLSNYFLFWYDDFNYSDTSQLYSSGKWKRGFPYNDLRGGTQNQSERYCDEIATNNYLSVSDGILKMSAYTNYGTFIDSVYYQNQYWRSQRESSILTANYNHDYPCQQNNETWLSGFAYGVFEARIKLPNVEGDYPAFWLWGDAYQPCTNGASIYSCLPANSADTLPCPTQGFCPGFEIDIFEAKFTREQWQSAAEQHFWITNQANGYQNPHCFPCATNYRFDNTNPQQAYHVYTLAWTPHSATWFIDGNEIRSQIGGLPKAKLNLILSLSTYANGKGGTMEIDYVKIYRPSSPNYTLEHIQRNNDTAIWATPDTNKGKFADYYNSYNNANYFTDGYQYFSAGFNSRTAENINSLYLHETNNPENQMLVYTLIAENQKKDNLLRTAKFYSAPNYSIFTTILDTLAVDIDNTCPFAAHTDKKNNLWIFYKSINNKFFKLRIDANNKTTTEELTLSNTAKLNLKNNLIFAESAALNTHFLAYTDNKNQLQLLIYDSVALNYKLVNTKINNIAANLTYSEKGYLYYVATNGFIYFINLNTVKYDNTNNFNQTELKSFPLIYKYNQNTVINKADSLKFAKSKFRIKELQLSADESSLLFINNYQEIVKLNLNNLSANYLPAQDALNGLCSRMIENNNTAMLEIFYISTEHKLKTLYPRYVENNTSTEWLNSTLDVFTQKGDFRIADKSIILSQFNQKIFLLNQNRRAFGFYDRRKDYISNALYYDCNNDDTFVIGLQF